MKIQRSLTAVHNELSTACKKNYRPTGHNGYMICRNAYVLASSIDGECALACAAADVSG